MTACRQSPDCVQTVTQSYLSYNAFIHFPPLIRLLFPSLVLLHLLLVPTSPPSNVVATPAGNHRVQVSWTPPVDVDVTQYVIMYSSPMSTTFSVTVDDASATSMELTDILVGVTYTIRVQANGDFPGPTSESTTITLTGTVYTCECLSKKVMICTTWEISCSDYYLSRVKLPTRI